MSWLGAELSGVKYRNNRILGLNLQVNSSNMDT